MNQVLFLCSGNYYRSRFAEYFFNWLAEEHGLAWRADSRGLVVGHAGNVGSISCYTAERLLALGIPCGEFRFPQQLCEADLIQSDLVIAVKEAEHRRMLTDLFPSWAEQVEYWHIDDLDCAHPKEALPVLEKHVHTLVHTLKGQPSDIKSRTKKTGRDAFRGQGVRVSLSNAPSRPIIRS